MDYGDGEPWDVDDSLLLTICEDCHKKEHELEKAISLKLSKALRSRGLAVHHIDEIAEAFQDMPKFHIHDVIASVIAYTIKDEDLLRALTKKYFQSLAEKRAEQEVF